MTTLKNLDRYNPECILVFTSTMNFYKAKIYRVHLSCYSSVQHTSSFSLSLTSNTANFKRVSSFTAPSGNTTVVRKYGSQLCCRWCKGNSMKTLSKCMDNDKAVVLLENKLTEFVRPE